MIIKGDTKIKTALEKHPELKDVLISYSSKFKKLNNKFIFNTVARWATFNDVAKIGKISICDLLHTVNTAIGEEENLEKIFPECIKEDNDLEQEYKPEWYDEIKQFVIYDVRDDEGYFFPKIIERLKQLKPAQALTVINSFDPLPLKRMFEEKGDKYYSEKINNNEFHFTILPSENDLGINPEIDWKKQLDRFPELNVIGMPEDPFELIMKNAQSIKPGQGFVLIQVFQPVPLVNMLNQMGLEDYTEEDKENRNFRIYFYKTPTKSNIKITGEKVPLVIQSATPITYPIIMRMLQSDELMRKIDIKELKVWEETEKHMAWIVNKKADITFSAVAAATKLYAVGADIKMVSVDIWDNFYLLTNGYEANSFEDIKNHVIQTPLFKEAPPTAVTKYIMKKLGYNPDDFDFHYDKPFGRPDKIKNDFISGKADTVLLREPEASFALYNAGTSAHESLSYKKLWNQIDEKNTRLPNAGLIFKNDFLKNHPDIANLFISELKRAIDWVNNNKKEAAMMSYDILRQSPEAVELFLNRAKFEHVPTKDIMNELARYIKIVDKKAAFDEDKMKGLFLQD